jgi:hypothetical protein
MPEHPHGYGDLFLLTCERHRLAAVGLAQCAIRRGGTEPHSETIDQFYDLLIALSYSIPWVLRTVLLLEAGLDVATLQEAYRDPSAYNHHITNTRNLLAGNR